MRLKEGVEGLHLCYALLLYFLANFYWRVLVVLCLGSVSGLRGFVKFWGGKPKTANMFSKNTLVIVLIKVILSKYIYITL